MKKNKKYLFGTVEVKNTEMLRSELDKVGLKIVGIQRSLRAKQDSLGKLKVEEYLESIVKNGKVEFKLVLIDKWCIKSGMAKIEATLDQNNGSDKSIIIKNVKIDKIK